MRCDPHHRRQLAALGAASMDLGHARELGRQILITGRELDDQDILEDLISDVRDAAGSRV